MLNIHFTSNKKRTVKAIKIYSVMLTVLGSFSIFSIGITEALLIFFSIPFIFPIFLMLNGVIILSMCLTYESSIFINGINKTPEELESELLKTTKERGYKIKKDF